MPGTSPHWNGSSVLFFRDDELWCYAGGKLSKVRDGESVLRLTRVNNKLLATELIYFPVFDQWAFEGKISSCVKLDNILMNIGRDASYHIVQWEYHPEQEGYGPGGITVIRTTPSLKPAQRPMERLRCVLVPR
jgi:hypothetical protein